MSGRTTNTPPLTGQRVRSPTLACSAGTSSALPLAVVALQPQEPQPPLQAVSPSQVSPQLVAEAATGSSAHTPAAVGAAFEAVADVPSAAGVVLSPGD